jgi:hypothetical protein
LGMRGLESLLLLHGRRFHRLQISLPYYERRSQ